MRGKKVILIAVLLVSTVFLTALIPNDLSPKVVGREQVSADAFAAMMSVVTHPRCMNCHPSGDRPLQGKAGQVHRFDVQRGVDGHGVPGLKCGTCHQQENNDLAGVPGAPHWHLAPRSMGWTGLGTAEIARAIMDPARNGGRSLDDIVRHMTEDPLVLWAWEPGVNYDGEARDRPPLSKEEWIDAVKTWVANGALIPESE